MPEHFDRWKTWYFGSSWALRLFISHHTELNNLYWAHEPVSRYMAREMKGQANSPAYQTLGFSGVDEGRMAPTLELWAEFYKGFNNWTRVSALIALSSYFEVYLKSIVSLALESDPGSSKGASRKVDGAVMLKYGTSHSYFEEANHVVIGDWSKRLKVYKELFGQVPPALQSLQGDLEKLRQLRNDAGHKFGRDMNEKDYRCRVKPNDMTQVGLPTLKLQLGVVEKAVRSIDSHLASQHVGSYEMVYFFHSNQNQIFEAGTNVRKFRKALGGVLGVGPSVKYCQELKAYYENL